MRNVARSMAIRMGVYGLLVAYLGLDLFVWKGPVHRSLTESPRDAERAIAEAKAEGVVARVYYRPIYRRQVEEALKEYLWRRGSTLEETSPDERKILRRLVVNQLIDDELVKLQIKVSTSEEVAVADERVEEALALEMNRYPAEEVFQTLAERAGWAGLKERRMRLAARIQRADHLERMLEVKVGNKEVESWFKANQDKLRGGLEENRQEIREALLVSKKDDAWEKFRLEQLRRRAEGKIDLFEDVLFSEDAVRD